MKKEIYDIKLAERQTDGGNVYYDISFGGGDLESVNSYSTALLLTFGVDSRAPMGEMTTEYNRRGWWGNLQDVKTSTGAKDVGSALWVIKSQPCTETNMRRGSALLTTAFNGWVDDKLIRAVRVQSVMLDNGYNYTITLQTPNDETQSHTFKLWLNTRANYAD